MKNKRFSISSSDTVLLQIEGNFTPPHMLAGDVFKDSEGEAWRVVEVAHSFDGKAWATDVAVVPTVTIAARKAARR